MNARIVLATSLLLAAPIARAQQPTMAPDGPPQNREVRMERRPEGGPGDMRGGMRHEGHGEFWKNPEVVAKLGLSPDQVKKLDDLALKNKLDEIHLRATLEEDEALLKPIVESPTFDEKKADAQIDKIAEAHAALEKARAKGMFSARAVLTADQWTKLHSHEGMMRHGMGEGPGGMRQHGPREGQGPGAPPAQPGE